MENIKIYTLEEFRKATEEFQKAEKTLKEFQARGGEDANSWEDMSQVQSNYDMKFAKYKEIYNAMRKPGTPPLA